MTFLLLFVCFCFTIYLIKIDEGGFIGYEWMNVIQMDEWDMNGQRDLLGWSSSSFLLLFICFCFTIYLIKMKQSKMS